MILPNHRGVGVGENGEGIPRFVGEIARDLRRVDADCDWAYAGRLKLRKPFFDAS